MNNRIFCVDDEIKNLKAITRLFRNEPFEIITFDSPIKALNKLDELQPSIVISDQCMPEMDGISFLEKVKEKNPETVRIILTGYANLETAITAINKGLVFLFIQKPWNDEELVAQVKSALQHQESIFCLRNIVDTLVDEIIDDRENNQAMCTLVAGIYSDLSQPMMIIDGYLQLLQDRLKTDAMSKNYLSNIMLQFQRIQAVVKKIKSLA